jgi:hypothetical protein
VLAAIIRSGEERILAIEGDRPDGALNDVGIDLDPAIIEKANKTVPTAEAIAIASATVLFRDTARLWSRAMVIGAAIAALELSVGKSVKPCGQAIQMLFDGEPGSERCMLA